MSKKGAIKVVAIIACVVLVGIIGLLLESYTSAPTAASIKATNTCVIGPHTNIPTRITPGIGNFMGPDTLCNAAVAGCGKCLQRCVPYGTVKDYFGCGLCEKDGYCNPLCAGNDADCRIEGPKQVRATNY